MSLELDGVKEVLRALERREKAVRKAAADGLWAEVQEVKYESQKRVPFDTGTLHDSAALQHPQWSGSRVSVEIGFGAPGVAYAAAVHETPATPPAPRSWGGRVPNFNRGGPKYLTNAINHVWNTGFINRMTDRIRRALG